MEKGDLQIFVGVEWSAAELVVRRPECSSFALPTVSAASPIILDRSASGARIKLAHAQNGTLWCASIGDNHFPLGGEC